MSIESISQNNYVLATQQAVTHDESMSGNGTVESPLSVVPGYNETVLWENNGSFSAKGVSAGFSEPASSFERLMFVCGTDVHNYNCLQVEYHPGSACLNWTEFYPDTFRYWTTQLNLGGNGMTAGAGYIVGWSYPNGTAFAKVGIADWAHCYKGIKKVIGINRKA